MITNVEQLHQAVGQLERMYRSLAVLRAEVLPKNARQFALMAEGPLDEIRHLQAQVDEYAGVAAAEEHDADVWLRIHGQNIAWLDVPVSVFITTLDAFRKGVQTVAEVLSSGRVRKRPNVELQRACDLRLVVLRPGSLCVGMRLPDEPDLPRDSSRERSLARQALVEYLTMASWVGGEDVQSDLVVRIKDDQKQRLLLDAVKPLVPRPHSEVECVEISGRLVPNRRSIRLTSHAYQRLTLTSGWVASEPLVGIEQSETYTGRLGEIDLDRCSFLLRDTDHVRQIRCIFADDLLETVRAALGRRVRVTGSRRAKRGRGIRATLHVSRLEVLDDRRSDTAD